jgi:hypothetical protein
VRGAFDVLGDRLAVQSSFTRKKNASPGLWRRYLAIGQWFASLPADEYPTLVALGADLTGTDPEERFRFGLDVLLTGLLAQKHQGGRSDADPPR